MGPRILAVSLPPLLLALLLASPTAAQPDAAPHQEPWRICTDAPDWTPIGEASCANDGTVAAERRIAALLQGAARPELHLDQPSLAEAQAAWTRYRELHCGLHDRGADWCGSLTPATVATCRLRLTLAREAQLRDLIEEAAPR